MDLKNEELKFSDVREKLLEIANMNRDTTFPGEDGVRLIEGFFDMPYLEKFKVGEAWEGWSVPMVAFMSKKTGRIYFFSLKRLIPEIHIPGKNQCQAKKEEKKETKFKFFDFSSYRKKPK